MTTGSIVQGLVPGLDTGLTGTTSAVVQLIGAPDGVVTSSVGSQIGININNGSVYQSIGIGGSSWISLGSVE